MIIGTLPDGARGVDVNQTVTADDAQAFATAGYAFIVRYVRRSQPHGYDLTVAERDDILNAGLGLQIVQHVAPDGWVPTPADGTIYGTTAATECGALGIPAGVSVWLDLEGVKPGTPHGDVIGFCNNWYDVVKAVGYTPSLYVGFHAGLSADELYRKLKFAAYWSAFTNNTGDAPVVRGFQMYQHAAKPTDLIPGYTNQTMDTDTIKADALGGTPTLLFV